MFGVVLWSDAEDRKAVIWCEDHGDLAFYNGETVTSTSAFSLDAGDLVQFDLSEDRNLRYATNPQLIADGAFPTLATDLAIPEPPTESLEVETARTNVIQFEPTSRRDEQNRKVLVAI